MVAERRLCGCRSRGDLADCFDMGAQAEDQQKTVDVHLILKLSVHAAKVGKATLTNMMMDA